MKTKPLLLVHIAILILVGTFFWPATRPFWDAIDLSVFKALNNTLKGHHYAQVFWALINHQLTDWVEDVIFIAFFVIAVRAAPRGETLRRTAQCIFLLVYAACLIFFVNRMLFRESFDIPRNSPTLVVSHCTRISDEIFWLKVKDDSTSSFPGDHATTLLLFAGGYTLIAGWRLGRYACLYALFRALPRLIAGAHWFTDIAVGSLSITLFFLAWGYLTPLHIWMTSAIESFLRLFTRKRTKNPSRINWARFANKKVGMIIALGLGLAYAAPFALEQLNQKSYPHFQNNPYLDKKTKKLMSPYLLPLDHTVKPKLDTLFSSRVISDKQTLLSAGFEIIAAKESSFITVARHPEIPGYVFKLYLDSEKRTKKHVPHCEWLTRRCIGAEKIRNIIKKKHLRYFSVPDKWLYVLPTSPSPNLESVIIVETDMQLENESISSRAWKTQITKEHLDELYSILKENCGSAFLPNNIPYTKNGTFAFTDTEYPNRKLTLKKATKYLSEENQPYWQGLLTKKT